MLVVVDIDHTMCHAAWRDEHLGQWDKYHSLAVDDKPAKEIINLVISLHNAGNEIYIVTCRPRKWLRQTFAWLHSNGIKVEQDHILMRPDGDNHTPSPESKIALTSHLDVDLVIEDRKDVADAFAEAGITTLLVRLAS